MIFAVSESSHQDKSTDISYYRVFQKIKINMLVNPNTQYYNDSQFSTPNTLTQNQDHKTMTTSTFLPKILSKTHLSCSLRTWWIPCSWVRFNFLCKSCCNWDQLITSPAKFFDETENTKYPNTCSHNNPHPFPANLTVNERYITCVKQSFCDMINTLEPFLNFPLTHGKQKLQQKYIYLLWLLILPFRKKCVMLLCEQKPGFMWLKMSTYPVCGILDLASTCLSRLQCTCFVTVLYLWSLSW